MHLSIFSFRREELFVFFLHIIAMWTRRTLFKDANCTKNEILLVRNFIARLFNFVYTRGICILNDSWKIRRASLDSEVMSNNLKYNYGHVKNNETGMLYLGGTRCIPLSSALFPKFIMWTWNVSIWRNRIIYTKGYLRIVFLDSIMRKLSLKFVLICVNGDCKCTEKMGVK